MIWVIDMRNPKNDIDEISLLKTTIGATTTKTT